MCLGLVLGDDGVSRVMEMMVCLGSGCVCEGKGDDGVSSHPNNKEDSEPCPTLTDPFIFTENVLTLIKYTY